MNVYFSSCHGPTYTAANRNCLSAARQSAATVGKNTWPSPSATNELKEFVTELLKVYSCAAVSVILLRIRKSPKSLCPHHPHCIYDAACIPFPSQLPSLADEVHQRPILRTAKVTSNYFQSCTSPAAPAVTRENLASLPSPTARTKEFLTTEQGTYPRYFIIIM